tara:strand:- start:1180 stop:1446 length:267 start_codon:yes stop_codon:yes gene_type:complete
MLLAQSWLSFNYHNNFRDMNINTFFLLLLVIAAYLNLYLTFNKTKQKKKTRLPISSKEWKEKVEDENFKAWLSNRERLKDKRKGDFHL